MRRHPRINLQTDPAIIRQALAHADTHGRASAARAFSIHYRTIERWQAKRDRFGDPSWPTEQDVADWHAHQDAFGAELRRKADRADRYRARVYINRGPVQVDPTGTTRRLQALHALGWTTADLAPLLGVSRARVGHLMTGLWAKLHPSTADAVRDLYDRLSMTLPPADPDPKVRGEVRVHERARRRARRLGYAPPLAWDEGAIDDPNARPYINTRGDDQRHVYEVDQAAVDRMLNGERMSCSQADKREVVRIWMKRGLPLKQLEARLGWKPERYTPAAMSEAS